MGNAVLGSICVYLGDGDGAETRLPTIGEVTDDLYGVRGTAKIWVDPVRT